MVSEDTVFKKQSYFICLIDPAAFPIYRTKKHGADAEHAFGFTVFYRRAFQG